MDTKKLRQKILDLAIRGRLVPQDPNDEPASVLLERIRAEKERLIKEGKIKRSKKSASDTPHYENVPFEVPEGWVWCRLSEIANYGGGKTPSMDNKQYWSNGTNLWITSKDMKCERITDSMMKISNDALDIMTQYVPGTLLMVTRSGILRHSLPIAILEEKATVNQDLKTISLHLKETHEYVYYAIKARERYILKEYHKDGTTVDSINFEKFAEILLPIPPYDEQKRIVIAIKQWLSFIDQLEQDANDLETSIQQTKTKILELAMHGKLVPQDPNDEPAIELLKRINPKFTPCDNAHDTNQLPDSWCWSTLGDVCSFISGYSYSSSEYKKAGIPLVRISDINDGIISLDNCAYIQPQGERNVYLQKGDILIAMSGATTGKMGIYMNEESAILNQRVGVVRVTDSKIISEKYRDYFLYRKSSDILKLAYGGAQPNISGKMICSLLLPLPPYSEQLRIVAKIEELFAVLDEIQKSIEA